MRFKNKINERILTFSRSVSPTPYIPIPGGLGEVGGGNILKAAPVVLGAAKFGTRLEFEEKSAQAPYPPLHQGSWDAACQP